tara:strand:- start:2676 stop:3128 length:453 start_codon:yes stop_codon:yes gene_type:complete
MKDKSMINMAGTSMGSGVKMCGSQVGKHMKMGGPKMMGGDEKKNKKKKTGENNIMRVAPWNSDAEEAAWAKRTLPNLTTTGLKNYKNRLKGAIGSNEIGAGNMVIYKKIKIIEREMESRKTPLRKKTMRLEKGESKMSGAKMMGKKSYGK